MTIEEDSCILTFLTYCRTLCFHCYQIVLVEHHDEASAERRATARATAACLRDGRRSRPAPPTSTASTRSARSYLCSVHYPRLHHTNMCVPALSRGAQLAASYDCRFELGADASCRGCAGPSPTTLMCPAVARPQATLAARATRRRRRSSSRSTTLSASCARTSRRSPSAASA
jgi:hypothetical protein